MPSRDLMPAILLAAGKGTRMRAAQPKPAVPVNGRPMALRVIEAVREAGLSRIIVVVGHRAGDVRAAIGDGVEYVVQAQQLGTGHAVTCAAKALQGFTGPVVVAYADIPLLRASDISALLERHRRAGAAATLLTARFRNPGTLGRILRASDGQVAAIVEARDASPEQLKIRETNVGVYCFTAPRLFELLGQLRNHNAQRQYYLTDVIGLLVGEGQRVEAVAMELPDAGLGVDTVEDLARAERLSSHLPLWRQEPARP
jgi:bifunctional UDP-N-acetylglucosamine pyrophosphorylase/glucosamine-1-phosphate N-acetyltransferase